MFTSPRTAHLFARARWLKFLYDPDLEAYRIED
jgi:hypothetical protein